MKIRTQLGLSLYGMLLVSFAIALGAVGWVLRQMVLSEIQQRQKAQVQTLAAVSGQALLLKDELFLLNYVRLVSAMPGVNYAYFVDASGKILVHTDPRFVYQPVGKWKSSGIAADSIEWEAPARVIDRAVGAARVGFSKAYTQAEVYRAWRRILTPLGWIAGVGAAISLALGLLLAYFMSRSIGALAKASREIGAGNLSVCVPVTASNELGELAEKFNYMAQQLRKLDQLKADFISIVSHDLRNPLGAIIAYSDYLLSGETGPLLDRQSQALQTIRDQCQKLAHMVDNILDMGKMQSGTMRLAREPFDLAACAEEVRKLYVQSFERKNLELRVMIPPQLAASLGDAEKIQQVLINLVSNALKFTTTGSVTIGARAASEPGAVCVFVSDTGPGIPPEELPRMFERFHQVNAQQQQALRIKGTGLGLAISKAFVEALGGRIWVESRLGQGTTFFFTLPKAGTGAFRAGPVAVGPSAGALLPTKSQDA